MNENLNLVEILKDCPKGTKLYSIVHGEVYFYQIVSNNDYPINFKYKNKKGDVYIASVTMEGKYSSVGGDECILFPSKYQRDWSKFNVEPEMVDGEFYYCFYGNNKKENSYIFIYKKHLIYKTKCYAALNMFYSILFKEPLITNNNVNITELRKATEEEKQLLLNTIKREGYKWDEEKKELVRIEPKFDISTLQPFDKVLVRDGSLDRWECTFFSYIDDDDDDDEIFVCNGFHIAECVPYNEETKHLVGTAEMPPKKYITWEE